MKITLEEEDLKVSIEVPDGQTSDKVLEYFEGLMIAFTYHPDTVKKTVIERADEYKDNQDNVPFSFRC